MKLNHKLIKSISVGVIGLGLLAGIGMASNNSTSIHADDLAQAMNQDGERADQLAAIDNANGKSNSVEYDWSLRHTWGYPNDLVNLLDEYPDLANTSTMNKMINYLSPKGREQFDEYYFNNSDTGAGANLKDSSDAKAGLNYDPNNSADNYLPLAHQHYISTAQEKKLQSLSPQEFMSGGNTSSKKHSNKKKPSKKVRKHNKRVNKHRHAKKNTKKVRKHAKHSIKRTRRPKKARRTRKSHKMSALAKKKLQAKYNKLGTYAQGKAQAKKDFTKNDIFKALIKNHKILSNHYYHGYDNEMSNKSYNDDDGDSYTSTISPAIENARTYLRGNKMVKKAIYDYYEHHQEPNSKLMNNHQYKHAFENASMTANNGD